MTMQRIVLLGLLALIALGATRTSVQAQATDGETAYQLRQGWFSRDKAYHVSISAAGAAGTYLVSRELGLGKWQATLVSIVATGTVGLLRETWDMEQPGIDLTRRFFSRRDMVWNGIGIAIGIPIGDLIAGSR